MVARMSEEELRKTWIAYEKAGYRIKEGAKALGVPRTTFSDRISMAKSRLGLTVPKKKLKTDAEIEKAAKAEAEKRDLGEDVALHRAKTNEKMARAQLKDAVKEISRLQDKIKDLEWAAKASYKPAEWATPSRSPKASEHMPYLLTSDFQIGEVIRAEETDHAVGYSTEIFRRRYRHLISTAIYLAQEHSGSSWKFPGIIYGRGGDTISGGIHDELRETDDLTPIEACQVAFEEEAAGIKKLADAFGRVEVKDCGGGNHDRNTLKPQSKRATAHSYDQLISYMLANEFARDKRVTFQLTKSPDIVFPIYGRNILLTHGDKIGSRGGQGFIGPGATILRGAKKVIMEQAAMGRMIDEVHMGHFHTFLYMVWVLCNGCLPGYSEFAKQNRMIPGPPEQTFAFYHPKRGMVDMKRIILTNA